MKHSLFLGLILIWNLVLSYQLFIRKDFKVRILEAQRVNIVEKDGTKKMGLFSSGQYQYGLSERQGQGTISGMLFFNEEGYETGGLVFDGKKIKGGQRGGIGLMFDGYRQDQTIKIEHDEYKDEQERYYEDGILIMARPDRADVKEEYDFYALKYPDQFGDEDTPRLSKEVLDSMEWVLSEQNKVATASFNMIIEMLKSSKAKNRKLTLTE